jgi:hypothetical protein
MKGEEFSDSVQYYQFLKIFTPDLLLIFERHYTNYRG